MGPTSIAAEKGAQRPLVFIAWSGALSGAIAELLHGWLDNVVPEVELFVSSKNLSTGGMWVSELSDTLRRTRFAILCLTRENLESNWISFEAGACAHRLHEADAVELKAGNQLNHMREPRVCPLLFDVKLSDLKDPIAMFQGRVLDRNGMDMLTRHLNSSIHNSAPEEKRRERFEVWWPRLEEKLTDVRAKYVATPTSRRSQRDPSDLLDEAIELLRQQRRTLADPSRLMPAAYIVQVISDIASSDQHAVDQIVKLIKSRKESRGTTRIVSPSPPSPAAG